MTQITNYEDCHWRQARLHRVMSGMMMKHGSEPVCERIASLHDHKGILEVRWRGSVDEDMAYSLGHLWELSGEPAENIRHEVD